MTFDEKSMFTTVPNLIYPNSDSISAKDYLKSCLSDKKDIFLPVSINSSCFMYDV